MNGESESYTNYSILMSSDLKDLGVEEDDDSEWEVEGANGGVDSVAPVLCDYTRPRLSATTAIFPAEQWRYGDTH